VSAVEVSFNQQDLSLKMGQTLLEAALDNHFTIPNSCRSGICQTCLVKIQTGIIPPAAQQGLSTNQIQQNLALACQLRPEDKIWVTSVDTNSFYPAEVISHEKLNRDVLRLRLRADIRWFPGQYLTLWKNSRLGRPFSIASLSSEGFLEFHIKRHEYGEISRWLHSELHAGQYIEISEPRGNSFYTPSMQQKPLLLIGAVTGLAPLYGIARDALAQKHPSRIDLLHVNSLSNQTYLHDELSRLVQQYPNFYFQSILLMNKQAFACLS